MNSHSDRSVPDVVSYLEDGAGDCELRSIAFAFPNVQLSFFDPYYDRPFYIVLRVASRLMLELGLAQSPAMKLAHHAARSML